MLTPKAQRTAAGASTTLTILSGSVAIRAAGKDFAPAEDGAILATGDAVRTGPDGRAVLTYFEGTTVEIEPSSELTIDRATAGTDGSTVLLMTQNVGRTWHVVTHLLSGNSRYEVRTPASTASVRGTQFEVAVIDDSTTVTTAEGRVATSDPAQTAEVLVTPGLTTTTKKGHPPTPPVPAPEPERRVTVTVADPNTLIVDPLGRANGFKDGKLVIQTPGASVRIVDGKLVVTLHNMPDGTLAAHAGKKDADVELETTVEERGSAPVTVTGRSGSDKGTAGVEVHRSSDTGPRVTSNNSEVPAPKVGEVPAAPASAPDESETPGPVGPGRAPEIRTAEPARPLAPGRTPEPSGFRPDFQLPGALPATPATPAIPATPGGPDAPATPATPAIPADPVGPSGPGPVAPHVNAPVPPTPPPSPRGRP